jgi:16S rRNA (adenine1518-N6/adenine1519-N6)-dimethyltransferase
MQHQPRKRFGQNFLQSAQVIEDIVRAIAPVRDDNIIEIGPGKGAITLPLLKRVNALTVIEIDRDLHGLLQALPEANDKLTLINEDALTIDFSQFGKHLKVVGNLPYNISTPLILHLLHYHADIDEMYFMLQKEVVDRLVSPEGSKQYGRLSVMVQYYCEADSLFEVPPEVFFPKPKVDSAVVRLCPHKNPPFVDVDFKDLERLVATAFSMRRKTLANNLKPLLSRTEIESLGIDPGMRPEQLPVEKYAIIAKYIAN